MAEKLYTQNEITTLDPDNILPSIFDLRPGDIFRYSDVKRNNVYMKVDGLGSGQRAVHLNSGMVYDISANARLVPVKMINIKST